MLPESVSAPIIKAKYAVTSSNKLYSVKSDNAPTNAEAPPPAPFNKATSSGICIILTFIDKYDPIKTPIKIAARTIYRAVLIEKTLNFIIV